MPRRGSACKPGMALADARAMYPALPVAEADAEADARLLEAIADWCDRYTPLVGLDPPDGLLLDITGCAHLFGGEAALARDLVARLAQQGFARARRGRRHGRLRLGRGALWRASASFRAAKRKRRCCRCRSRRCASMPRSSPALTTVGAQARRRSRRRGRARRSPRASAQSCSAASIRRSAAPTSRSRRACRCRRRWPSSAFPIRSRARTTCSAPSSIWRDELAACWSGAARARGSFQLALFRADGTVHRLEIGTGAPLRDPARVRKLFEDRLAVLGDACDPGFGYDMVRLSALVTERSDPAQTGLAGARPRARSWRI